MVLGRTLIIKVPLLLTPIEGSVECSSTILPEVRAVVDDMLRVVGVTDQDTVVEIATFYQASKTNGESEPVPIPAPELLSVT